MEICANITTFMMHNLKPSKDSDKMQVNYKTLLKKTNIFNDTNLI